MKSSEACIKTRSPPASLTIQRQVTKHTTVKWPSIVPISLFERAENGTRATKTGFISHSSQFQRGQKAKNAQNPTGTVATYANPHGNIAN